MKPLIILEMANNHSGDVDRSPQHYIRTYADICDKYRSTYDFIFKFNIVI